MWWTLIANMLSQNDKDAQASQAAGAQRQQAVQQNVQQNRARADTIKNQTMSANYGKYDMNSLVGGVFSKQDQQQNYNPMNWGA